jgi:prepilin-type N-terminal cleavage/methylation domain-containing protein
MSTTEQQGFTLIELITVIIIMAIASVPLFSLFSQTSVSMVANERIQTATQLAQERAEHLLAVRRNQGYAAADISIGQTELLTGNYSNYTRTTSIIDETIPYAGSDCPAVGACKQITVSIAEAGKTRAEIAFVLVNY